MTLPGPSLNDMLLKWRDECDAARELEREPEVGFRVRYKGRNGDKPDWETSSDEEGAADPEEDFQVRFFFCWACVCPMLLTRTRRSTETPTGETRI